MKRKILKKEISQIQHSDNRTRWIGILECGHKKHVHENWKEVNCTQCDRRKK